MLAHSPDGSGILFYSWQVFGPDSYKKDITYSGNPANQKA